LNQLVTTERFTFHQPNHRTAVGISYVYSIDYVTPIVWQPKTCRLHQQEYQIKSSTYGRLEDLGNNRFAHFFDR
jgi:hypothetical protein